MKLKIISISLILISIVVLKISPRITQKKIPLLNEEKMTVRVFSTQEGWGYAIIKDEDLFIKQPYIPAIQRKTPFKTRKDALNTGNLVVDKIKQDGYPAITVEDLKRLKIDF